MSLRYIGRVLYQAAGNMRVALQATKIDQASSRCDSALKSIKSTSSGFNSRQATRRLSTSAGLTNMDKVRLKEESLRTVMYLSCWGPF